MPLDAAPTAEEQAVLDDEQAERDFESGMPPDAPAPKAKPDPEPKPAKPDAKPEAKPDAKSDAGKDAPPAAPAPAPVPKHIRITQEQYDALKAAADKTGSLEAQMSKAFGTIGNMQKVLNTLQSSTPRGDKIEIPKDAFAEMEKDFPELAQQLRAALEKSLRGFTGTGPANAESDPDKLSQLLKERATEIRSAAELEDLEDEFPDWRKIVGQVNTQEQQPDPNNPYRKWLASKDAAYQAKINGTQSAAVIARSIRLFQSEAKAPATPAPSPRHQAQAERIRGAVQPRGDGGQPPAKGEDDDFLAGFNSR